MIETVYEKGWVQIYVEGELWRKVSPRLFGKKPNFSEKNLKQLEEKERKRALNFCVASLAKKGQHSCELRKKMRELGIGEEAAESTLFRLQELHLLDDEQWIARFMELKREKLSSRALRDKLRQKGVPSEEVEEALKEGSDHSALQKILAKKKAPQSDAERQRLIRSLLSKGFSWEHVQENLSALGWLAR